MSFSTSSGTSAPSRTSQALHILNDILETTPNLRMNSKTSKTPSPSWRVRTNNCWRRRRMLFRVCRPKCSGLNDWKRVQIRRFHNSRLRFRSYEKTYKNLRDWNLFIWITTRKCLELKSAETKNANPEKKLADLETELEMSCAKNTQWEKRLASAAKENHPWWLWFRLWGTTKWNWRRQWMLQDRSTVEMWYCGRQLCPWSWIRHKAGGKRGHDSVPSYTFGTSRNHNIR